MVLGNRGDYAVRAMLHLSRQYGGGRCKTQDIAEGMKIPRQYLSRILANLVRHGLLTAVAGPSGGYELSRPPSRISLLDVIEAAEEETTLKRCILRGIPCGKRRFCAVHDAWFDAQGAMVQKLKKTTFADICNKRSRNAFKSTPTEPVALGGT